jgi:hypothetical protein
MTTDMKLTIEKLIESQHPDIVNSNHDYKMIYNMLKVIVENTDLIVFVRDFDDEDTGFMWSKNTLLDDIHDSDDVKSDGHSGASFGNTLRNCQYILRNIDEHTLKLKDASHNHENKSQDLSTSNTIGAGDNYLFYEAMDDTNKTAMDVLVSSGPDAAIEHMFKDPKNPNRKLSYSEMRYLYG